jgi:tetratricopeptide (TPR) repeat protein
LQEAVEFYERSQNRAPLPDTIVALGDLYQKLGRLEDAKRQYELVEFVEKTSAASGTYSRQLAVFWADHDQKLDQALAIMQRERSSRADIFTCDASAWALFKNNRIDEASKVIEEALRLGTRDAKIYYHAGMIYNAAGDRAKGTKFLKLALATNPVFDLVQADVARQTLQSIRGQVSRNEKRGA